MNTREQLRQWLAVAANRPLGEIADDTLLIQHGLITSLQVMDLLLQIESITGSPIAVERLEPGAFASLDAIMRAFVPSQSGAAHAG
jgi:hypothetical protein